MCVVLQNGCQSSRLYNKHRVPYKQTTTLLASVFITSFSLWHFLSPSKKTCWWQQLPFVTASAPHDTCACYSGNGGGFTTWSSSALILKLHMQFLTCAGRHSQIESSKVHSLSELAGWRSEVFTHEPNCKLNSCHREGGCDVAVEEIVRRVCIFRSSLLHAVHCVAFNCTPNEHRIIMYQTNKSESEKFSPFLPLHTCLGKWILSSVSESRTNSWTLKLWQLLSAVGSCLTGLVLLHWVGLKKTAVMLYCNWLALKWQCYESAPCTTWYWKIEA